MCLFLLDVPPVVLKSIVSTCSDLLLHCYELEQAAASSVCALGPSERDLVNGLTSLLASGRLSMEHTIVQHIAATVKALLSDRGTVSDWSREVPALYDAVCLVVAKYGPGPLLTLVGRAYEHSGRRGGKHVIDPANAILLLPGYRRIKALLSAMVVPLDGLVEPCELQRFMSVMSSAACVLFDSARARIASIIRRSVRVEDGFYFNYKTGYFALSVADPQIRSAVDCDIELKDISRRFRVLQVVRTDRSGASGTCIILSSSGADGAAIAPALTVNTVSNPITILGCVGNEHHTALTLQDISDWQSKSPTDLFNMLPPLAKTVNAHSLCSLGGAYQTIVGTSFQGGADASDVDRELRAHSHLVRCCSRCLQQGLSCVSHCPACSLWRTVCKQCLKLNIPPDAIDDCRRPCFSCAFINETCVRVVPVLFTTDNSGEQARMKTAHTARVMEAQRVRNGFMDIGTHVRKEHDLHALARALRGNKYKPARASRALAALGVSTVEELRDLLAPFNSMPAGDDGDHVIKLLKMLNGRVLVHPFGLLSRDMIKVIRYSPAFGAELQRVLPAALVQYNDRQDPSMVATLFIKPVANAILSLGVKCVVTYLNHGVDASSRAQVGLSKQVGAADTHLILRPMFTCFTLNDGGRVVVLSWDRRSPMLHFCHLQTASWQAQWQSVLLSDASDESELFPVFGQEERVSFDISQSRPGGLAILNHVYSVGECIRRVYCASLTHCLADGQRSTSLHLPRRRCRTYRSICRSRARIA